MTAQAPTKKGVSIPRVLLIALAAFVVGVLVATGAAAIQRWITDDSRSSLSLADVIRDDLPGFANANAPSQDACGDRHGCVEGVVGDGVAAYRYDSLNLAREAIMFGDADFYRSDRLVFEFDEGLPSEERLLLLQVVEGTWTTTSD